MKPRSKNLKLFTFLFCLSLISLGANAGTSGVLQDFKGNIKSLDDYTGKGKWLVVMLWASDCHVCNQEAHEYVAFHGKHANGSAHVLGVSLDGAKKKEAEQFLKKHSVNFPNLIGEAITVATLYEQLSGGSWIGTPSFLVYNPQGKLVGAQVGAVPTSVIESFIEKENQNSP